MNFVNLNATNHERLIELSHQYPILAFDGHCILCDRSIRMISATDKKRVLRYVSLQEALPQASDYDTVLLYRRGKVYERSDVWLQFIDMLGGWYHLFRVITIIPKSLLNKIYDIIARNRYKWFGRMDQCPIPTGRLQELFIHL